MTLDPTTWPHVSFLQVLSAFSGAFLCLQSLLTFIKVSSRLVGMQNGTATKENSMAGLKNIYILSISFPYDPAIPVLDIY